MNNKTFYITTAIAYASATPHIGNDYEIILADSIARFKRLDGYDVRFQTGTDEHGQKIANNAKNNELSPQAYVDMVSGRIRKIYDRLNISYDKFIKTTDTAHKESVQKIYKKLLDQGDIYLGHYEGLYSLAEEAFVNEKDLIDGKTAQGDIPIWTSEESYFFKLDKFQEQLKKHILNNPNFIYPESRKNEMLNNFINEKLFDVSVTRTSFDWGIRLPFDDKHISYVWIDALSNYITGLGYDPNLENQPEEFVKYWPADVHVIGKDILRFHTVFWPILLMALGLELPKQIFGHPWILFDKSKMSKSKGNVIYTDKLIDEFGVDVVRYYCLHEIPFGTDGNITYELVIERNNSDLANTLGNLVNRTLGMVNKYRGGEVKRIILDDEPSLNLRNKALNTLPTMRKLMDEFKVADALDEAIDLARAANKYIDLEEPWVLFKDDLKKDELDNVLYHLIETIRFLSVLLAPFMPGTARRISEQINFEEKDFKSLTEFGLYPTSRPNKAEALFQRYDLEEKMEKIINKK